LIPTKNIIFVSLIHHDIFNFKKQIFILIKIYYKLGAGSSHL
jgi:hypothetical protein